MRIGAFAKKYDVKKSTIRYYTDINLLIPKKIGHYPMYEKRCDEAMEEITLLKNMGFSIEEILMIVNYERISVTYSANDIQNINNVFDRKVSDVHRQIEKLEDAIKSIRRYQSALHQGSFDSDVGNQYWLFNQMSCTECKQPLLMKDANIHDNKLKTGIFQCEKHESWQLLDGILSSDLSAKEHQKSSRNYSSISDRIDAETISQVAHMQNMGDAIIQRFQQWDHTKGVVFLAADTDISMIRLDKYMHEDGVYIFVSHQYHDLFELQRKLRGVNAKGNILFIHSMKGLPFKQHISYVVDNASIYYDHGYHLDDHHLYYLNDLKNVEEILSTQFILHHEDIDAFNEENIDRKYGQLDYVCSKRQTLIEEFTLPIDFYDQSEAFPLQLLVKLYTKKNYSAE